MRLRRRLVNSSSGGKQRSSQPTRPGHAAQRVLITGTQAGGPASRRRAAARGQDPVKQPGSSGGHQGQIEVAAGHGPGVAGPVPGVTVKLAWRRSCLGLVRADPVPPGVAGCRLRPVCVGSWNGSFAPGDAGRGSLTSVWSWNRTTRWTAGQDGGAPSGDDHVLANGWHHAGQHP